jgi:DNA-binding LacI/PurR family transcriptional regulator
MTAGAEDRMASREAQPRKRVRIADLARYARLAPSTVSCVLNNRQDVPIAEKTRERVLRAAKKLGFVANPVARALRTGRTHTIGLAVPQLGHPYCVALLQQLHRHIALGGYSTMIVEGVFDERNAEAQEDALRFLPVDGVIAQATSFWLEKLRARDPSGRFPVVRLDAEPVRETGDFVSYSFEAGARAAVRHLLDEGSRRVALLAPTGAILTEDERHKAYVDVVRKARCKPQIIAVPAADRAAACQGLLDYLRTNECPDGLFCYNDDMALGAYRALTDLGRRIPEDVAIVGCDGLSEGATACPRLSSVVIPLDDVCARAWEFLQRRLAEPTAPQQTARFETRLVVRESSRRIS